jgi:ABC-type transport system involved in multi-copper enzyme maturation permease subunit
MSFSSPSASGPPPSLPTCRPSPLRTSAAVLRDTWREFRDARVLWLLLAAIALLFAVALSARVAPQPAGRGYLDLAAKALSADLTGIDLVEDSLSSLVGRLDGSLSWIVAAEPTAAGQQDAPTTSWSVTLARSVVPLVGSPETPAEVRERFGRIPDGRLWTVREIRETTGSVAAALGHQTWQMVVDPGPDLRLLWPHRFTLFADSLELTRPEGAPLGLEVFILQKLLSNGIGGSVLLLVSVVVTAAFVPNMLRRGTLELLLVRPLPRWQLIVFKYMSAFLFVGGLLGLLVLATWLVTGLLTSLWSPGIILALPSLLLFFALLLSVSVFTGVLTRSATAAMLATVASWAVLFVLGLMHSQTVASRLREEDFGKPRPVSVADALRSRQPARDSRQDARPKAPPFHTSTVSRVIEALYEVLPHTEDLDTMVDRQLMRGFAVGGRLRRLVESPDFTWAGGVGLTLVHTACFLAAACLIFSRRDP